MQQNTPEWLNERAGKINGSEMCDVMAFAMKSGVRTDKPLKARTDLVAKIVGEILTGEPAPQSKSKSMDWGHDVEKAARRAYEAMTGEIVELVASVTHPRLPYVRCSPDGRIGTNGGIQIKCPANPVVHITTLRDGMPIEHLPQVQAEIAIQGLEWIDFVSFDPRMPERIRLFVQRVYPDKEFIAQMEQDCESLWGEVTELLETIGLKAA